MYYHHFITTIFEDVGEIIEIENWSLKSWPISFGFLPVVSIFLITILAMQNEIVIWEKQNEKYFFFLTFSSLHENGNYFNPEVNFWKCNLFEILGRCAGFMSGFRAFDASGEIRAARHHAHSSPPRRHHSGVAWMEKKVRPFFLSCGGAPLGVQASPCAWIKVIPNIFQRNFIVTRNGFTNPLKYSTKKPS